MDDSEKVKAKVLEEYTRDVRSYMHTLKTIVLILCSVLVVLIGGLVALEINHQNRMMEVANHASDKIVELLSEYDWEVEYEIETTNNELMSGNVYVER